MIVRLVLFFAVGIVVLAVVASLSGCQTGTTIAACPPDRCVGPYDITLSSHREALLTN